MTLAGEAGKIDTMENNKLKKLGKYFTKGAKIGLMAAMLATTACNNELELGEKPTEIEQPTSKYEIEQDLEKHIFERHRFVRKDEEFLNGGEFGTLVEKGNFYYYHAKEFMGQKLALFNDAMQRESNPKFKQLAQNMVDNNRFNDVGTYTIDKVIAANCHDYGAYLGNIIYPMSIDDRGKFMACYDYLANRAYNDSLGQRAGQKKQANKELTEIKQELRDHGVDVNDHAVEGTLCEMLQDIEWVVGVSSGTLFQGVNIALFNEGMWGARDLGGSAEAITSNSSYKDINGDNIGERERSALHSIIRGEMQRLSWQQEQQNTMER